VETAILTEKLETFQHSIRLISESQDTHYAPAAGTEAQEVLSFII
jgi:hypothetical protein